MKLLTKQICETLAANGRKAASDPDFDPAPAVKLFTPSAGATWLLAWTDPDDPDLAHGLCDLGLGSPEVGPVRLSDLALIRAPLGLGVERDRFWKADKPLSAYAAAAVEAGVIVA